MSLVKVRRAAQITLPADVREKLRVREGDYLEAEVVEGGVLLKPVSVVEREKAWDSLMRIINEPKRREPTTMSPEEEEEWLAEEVKAARREEHAKGRR